jgi:tetratricopeptide (TPR) repeat protein
MKFARIPGRPEALFRKVTVKRKMRKARIKLVCSCFGLAAFLLLLWQTGCAHVSTAGNHVNIPSAYPTAYKPQLWNTERYNLALPYFGTALDAELDGRWSQAITWYQKGLTIFPNAVDQLGFLGSDYMHLGDCRAAVATLRRALIIGLQLKPPDAPDVVSQGDSLLRKNRYPEAFKSYYAAWSKLYGSGGAEVNPNFVDSGAAKYLSRGLELASNGNIAQAVEAWGKAVRISPDFEEALCYQGAGFFCPRPSAGGDQELVERASSFRLPRCGHAWSGQLSTFSYQKPVMGPLDARVRGDTKRAVSQPSRRRVSDGGTQHRPILLA